MLLPRHCFAGQLLFSSGLHTVAQIIALLNFVLLFTSVMSIKQFFFPGEVNRTVFHIGNIVFMVLFYLISFSFLFSNREYYEGYDKLTNLECMQKVFLSLDLYSAMQWLILVSLVFNILYISRYAKDYYKG